MRFVRDSKVKAKPRQKLPRDILRDLPAILALIYSRILVIPSATIDVKTPRDVPVNVPVGVSSESKARV